MYLSSNEVIYHPLLILLIFSGIVGLVIVACSSAITKIFFRNKRNKSSPNNINIDNKFGSKDDDSNNSRPFSQPSRLFYGEKGDSSFIESSRNFDLVRDKNNDEKGGKSKETTPEVNKRRTRTITPGSVLTEKPITLERKSLLPSLSSFFKDMIGIKSGGKTVEQSQEKRDVEKGNGRREVQRKRVRIVYASQSSTAEVFAKTLYRDGIDNYGLLTTPFSVFTNNDVDDKRGGAINGNSTGGTAPDSSTPIMTTVGSIDTFFDKIRSNGGHVVDRNEIGESGTDDDRDGVLVIFLVSTYGEGEPPDTMREFYRWLKSFNPGDSSDFKRDTIPSDGRVVSNNLNIISNDSNNNNGDNDGNNSGGDRSTFLANSSNVILSSSGNNTRVGFSPRSEFPFKGVDYAVFALGDSQYRHYCKTGKELDMIVNKLGGRRIFKLVCGDDNRDIEQDFDNWRKAFWPVALTRSLGFSDQYISELMLKKRNKSIRSNHVGDNPPYVCQLKLTLVDNDFKGGVNSYGSDNNYSGDRRNDEALLTKPFPAAPFGLDPTQRLPVYLRVIQNEELTKYRENWGGDECLNVAKKNGIKTLNEERKVVKRIVFDLSKKTTENFGHGGEDEGNKGEKNDSLGQYNSPGCGLRYQPGDHLGVLPHNTDKLVDEYLSRLGVRRGGPGWHNSNNSDTVGDSSGSPDARVNVGVDPDKSLVILRDRKTMKETHFPSRLTVRETLKWYLDLTGPPKRSVLRIFANYCRDDKERLDWLTLLNDDDDDDDDKKYFFNKGGKKSQRNAPRYQKILLKLRNVLGFLRKYRSCDIPLECFFEVMPRLLPRYYSVSSDPCGARSLCPLLDEGDSDTSRGKETLGEKDRMELVKRKKGKTIEITVVEASGGLCSTMLCSSSPVGTIIPVFIRKSNFHLYMYDNISDNNKDDSRVKTPIIMVGPGTGVAPFIGFLEKRQYLIEVMKLKLGPAILFFGCRRSDQDYLYKDYLRYCLENNEILTSLEVCFSREGKRDDEVLNERDKNDAKDKYVQHLMAKRGKEIWDMLTNQKGVLYLCGDANRMAVDIESCLKNIIETQGKPRINADLFIDELQDNMQYLKDVWSK